MQDLRDEKKELLRELILQPWAKGMYTDHYNGIVEFIIERDRAKEQQGEREGIEWPKKIKYDESNTKDKLWWEGYKDGANTMLELCQHSFREYVGKEKE